MSNVVVVDFDEANETREQFMNRVLNRLTQENELLTARITELETANKGLQIALLDASEKEKELQLRNAMLVEQLNDAAESVQEWGNYADQYFQEKWNLAGDVQKYKDVANATSAQSAAWLENSHREWMKGLPIAGAYTVSLFRGYYENTEFQPSIDFAEGTHKLYAIPPTAEERKD